MKRALPETRAITGKRTIRELDESREEASSRPKSKLVMQGYTNDVTSKTRRTALGGGDPNARLRF
jgi:hypothetical protein